MNQKLLITSSAMALCLMAATSANAQETNPDGAAADGSAGLQEIVVTAQRRSENLQKAAIAVTAVSGDQLAARGVVDVAALANFAPALVVQPGVGSNISLYIRGVGGVQGNAFAENPIAFNFNDVYVARPSAVIGSFYDLERVEVLKGPQGTLYGRNATGGAINVVPRRPALGAFGGDFSLQYGNYEHIQASAAVNLPVGANAALRVAGQVVTRDGYLSDGYDDQKTQSIRASFLVEPSPDLSMLIVGDYFHQGGKGGGSVLVPGVAFPATFPGYSAPSIDRRIGGADPRSIAALADFSNSIAAFAPPFCPGGFVASGCVAPPRADGYVDSDYYGVSAQVKASLGFADLTIIPAYRESRVRYLNTVTGNNSLADETSKQTSVEARLSSNGDARLNYILGGYFFHEKQDASNFFDQGTLSTAFFTPKLKTRSIAAFGQLTYSLTDTFRVVGGGRYTDERREQSTALASGGLPRAVYPPLGPPFLGLLKFNRFTWKAGVEWDAGPRSLLYASVATGFKSGGFFVALAPNNTFRPEKLTAYTIGTKNRFFDNRLQLNVEAFYWKYTNQQLTYVGPITGSDGLIGLGGLTINSGSSRMYGFDTELRWAVTPNGTFSADVQYLNGKYTNLKFVQISASGAPLRSGCTMSNVRPANPGVPFNFTTLVDTDCSGKPTIASPKWTATIAYEHRFALDNGLHLIANLGTRLETSRYTQLDYLPEMKFDGFMMSNGSLTLEGKDRRWSLTAYIDNIEDKTVVANTTQRAILQTVYASLRAPRTYGVRAAFSF